MKLQEQQIKKISLYYVAFCAALCVLAIPFFVFAGEEWENPIGNTTLMDFFNMILTVMVYMLFPFVVLMMVYTGFLFVQAQGNESKISEARKTLLWTVVGAVILLGAFAISEAVKQMARDIIGEELLEL